MGNRIHEYILANEFERPTLVFSIDKLADNYNAFVSERLNSNVHYAVKANPHPSILSHLVSLGSRFDAASAGEITLCLEAGAKPSDISFGNTVKRVQDIAYAHQQGIDLFAVDSFEEIEKVAEYAPGARVFVRILIQSTEAEWPLSRKFGCCSSMVVPLMQHARSLHLNPVGISFHIGSQTRHPHMWIDTLDYVSSTWHHCIEAGFDLSVLNIGGGFPAFYGVEVTETSKYIDTLAGYIEERFGSVPYLMIEPGRGLVANLGSIAAEVLLVSHKTMGDPIRWVYLNIGRFSGLAETEQEAIKYQLIVPGKEKHAKSECIIAGPTCDSADVLYEKHKVMMPTDLRSGDKVIINNTGAYTTTYSTVCFNGFPPLDIIII